MGKTVCRLLFCGDLFIKQTRSDCLVSEEFSRIVKECNVRCVNLEGPMISHECRQEKKIGPSIYQEDHVIDLISDAGFNVAILANNHIMDYGEKGLDYTCGLLNEHDIKYVGAASTKEGAYKPLYYNIDNLTVGLLALAERGFGSAINNKAGYAWFGDDDIKSLIVNAKRNCDILVLNVHAGLEEFAYPLPEVRKLYKEFIDYGVDVIIGHHPHVIQGYEYIDYKPVFYSLGNFAFDNPDHPSEAYNPLSICVQIKIDNYRSIDAEVIPVIYDCGVVRVLKNNEYNNALDLIKHLNGVFLNPREYLRLVNEYCLKVYERDYKIYYNEGVVGKYKRGVKGFLKWMRRIFVSRTEFDDRFLYALICIETHLWVCKRAVYLKTFDKFDNKEKK